MDKEKMIEWIGTQNVGVSSKTMWVALMCPQCVNGNDYWNYDVPRDVGDFSRCYHLSKFARLSLDDLRKVEKVFPYWKPIIEEWANLFSAYVGMCYDSVFDILQEKHDEIMKLKGFTKTSDSTWERKQIGEL
jgi:hypothetical protein